MRGLDPHKPWWISRSHLSTTLACKSNLRELTSRSAAQTLEGLAWSPCLICVIRLIFCGHSGEMVSSNPGYPLQSVGLEWGAIAAFAYSFSALMVFADDVFPQQLQDIIYSIFKSHDNIVYFGLFAITIHVGYVIFAINLSRRRGYNAKATAWWASQCFIFGFLGVNLLLKKQNWFSNRQGCNCFAPIPTLYQGHESLVMRIQ